MQEFQPNDTISNRYKVLRKLGAGAMGSVYLCEDSVENNIKVALKVLVSDDLEDQDIWAKGEYEALTRLRHPNLARVYNFGRIGDTKDYFIVSEFIKGIDLYSATEYLRYDELVDIIVQICRALEYIHSQGYVHFDIKPDNILVTRYKTIGIKEGSKVQYSEADLSASKREVCVKPHVKLIDFGLAEKITGSFSFAIKGTLNYLAPEILNGQTPDKRADLYSLGVTLYQVANRDLPFFKEIGFPGSPSPVTKRSELFGIHMKKHPEYLRTLILKLLEESVDDRFQNAKDVIQFINRHSGFHFDVETPETRDSYFYSSRLIGRRREVNLLKEYHERAFFPHRCSETRRVEEGDEVPPAGQGGEALSGDKAAAAPATAAKKMSETAPGDGTPSTDCPVMVVVSGEMGSGKSRLLEEFQHYLKLRDFPFFSGNCYEGNRKAYQPFIEVLKQLVYSLGFGSEIYQKYLQDILKLLPEMRQKQDQDVPKEDEESLRPDKDKLCFIDRISQLILEAAQASPFVIVMNNLHWVDEASVALLENLLTRIADLREGGQPAKLMTFVSLRPEEPISDRLRDLMDKGKESGFCREIQLRRFKYAQIQEFLRSMLNFSDVPDGFVAKLMEKTGGNPLFIVETLKTLESDGIIRNCGDCWVIKTTNYDRIEIPHRMEDMLEKRLEKLDPAKRGLLEVLSVVDKPANPKFIQKLKRFKDTPILVELRNLEQTGIVTKIFEDGKLHFQIAQPKVREILYEKIGEEAKQKYHGEVAELFLEIYSGREEEILEEVAYHYQRSDQTSKAIEMAIKAGDRLKKIYANERALEYYMYVLEKVEADPAFFDQWVEIHEKLGDLCSTMGRYDIADRSYSALLDEDTVCRLDSRRVIKILLARGKVFEIQGDYDLALKCYKDARNYLANFQQDELVVERIRVFNSIGWIYVCMGKYEKAMTISLEALKVIDGVPERIEHAMVYNTIGSANFFKGNYKEAIEYHRRSLQIKENLENMPEITTSLSNLGGAYMAASEYGEAAEHFQRALHTSEEIGDPYGKAIALHNFSRLYFAVGQPDKGWERLEESMKLSKIHNMRYLNIQNYIVRGAALMDQGDCSKAEGNFFRALTAYTKQANRWGLCVVLLHIAKLHRLTGNFSEGLSMVAESRRYSTELDIQNLQAMGLMEEARIRREQGDDGAETAVKLIQEAIVLAEKYDHPEISGEVYLEMAETLVRMRQLQDATKYYGMAEEKFREVVDNLPTTFRDTYQARQRARFRHWKVTAKVGGGSAFKDTESRPAETPPAIEPTPKPAEAPTKSRAEDSLERMNRLMMALHGGESLVEFLGKMLDDILAISSGEAAFLLWVQGENLTVDTSRAVAGKTVGDPEKVICLPLIEKVLSTKKPLLLADIADDPFVAQELESRGIPCTSLAVVAFPIETSRQVVLYVMNPQLPRGGGQENLFLLQPFLNLASLAYHQLSPVVVPE